MAARLGFLIMICYRKYRNLLPYIWTRRELSSMQHINDKVNEYKEADGWLYAIYGTPAESLCGLQVEQFRKKYGVVKNVSDRPYVSNSFHNGFIPFVTLIPNRLLTDWKGKQRLWL